MTHLHHDPKYRSRRVFERPLHHAVGQPLRVSVYTRLAEGIRRGVFALGEMLPRETELSMMLGVSRPPVREALMLLEETGR